MNQWWSMVADIATDPCAPLQWAWVKEPSDASLELVHKATPLCPSRGPGAAADWGGKTLFYLHLFGSTLWHFIALPKSRTMVLYCCLYWTCPWICLNNIMFFKNQYRAHRSQETPWWLTPCHIISLTFPEPFQHYIRSRQCCAQLPAVSVTLWVSPCSSVKWWDQYPDAELWWGQRLCMVTTGRQLYKCWDFVQILCHWNPRTKSCKHIARLQ